MSKNKLYLILALLAIILSFSLYSRIQQKKIAAENFQEEVPDFMQNITYSRITFFHTQPHIGSLLIPSYWEGNYRIAEADNRAIFSCIANNKNVGLFEIISKNGASAVNDIADNTVNNLQFNNENDLSYSCIESKEKIKDEQDFCYFLQKDIKKVISTFKTTKIN
jgi:hypothetical protein